MDRNSPLMPGAKAFGYFGLGMVVIVILYPICAPPRISHRDPKMACLSYEKQISLAIKMYSDDYDDTLPRAKRWMDLIFDYTKNTMLIHEPTIARQDEYGYAFHDRASGKKITKIAHPESFELVFDSILMKRNAYGGTWSMPEPGRHDGGNNIAYVDGHAKRIPMH